MTQTGGNRPGKGTLFAGLTAVLILAEGAFLALVVGLVGDCGPAANCKATGHPVLGMMLLVVPAVAALLGLLVRQIAGAVSRALQHSSQAAAAIINLLIALIAAWFGYALLVNLPVN